MKRVTEVREARAEKFWEARMKGKVSRERKADKAQLENELHLVRAPASLRAGAAAEADAEADEEVEAMAEEEAPAAEAPAKARAPRARAPKLKVAAGDRMRE
jgi:hypothetical protein